MAGGSMTITVPTYAMLQQVAQRVTCWAGGVGGADTRRVQIVSVTPGPAAIRIPEEIFAAHGALALEPGGSDILSGYVAGTHVTFAANNGTAAAMNPNTCAADPANAPTISTITLSGLQATVNYANAVGAGTVNITWGDGTATNGAAESGASAHTYGSPGWYTIRITDASVSTDFIETTIYIP